MYASQSIIPVAFLGLLISGLLISHSAEAATGEHRFSIGEQFDHQLELPARIYWSEVPLREALHKLSRARRLAVWLDRRCDPDQPISFSASLPSLKSCLLKLSTDDNNIEAVWLQNVIYVGPRGMGDRLATTHEVHRRQLGRMPREWSSKWHREQPIHWPKLTSPPSLLDTVQEDVGHAISGKARVLHDLWPETVLPPMPNYQTLELILAGFELSFEFRAKANAHIVEMPRAPRYVRPIEVPDQGGASFRRLLQKHTTVDYANSRLTASWLVHQLAQDLLAPKTAGRGSEQIRYTLQAENQPLGSFLQGLCQQLGLQCELDGLTPDLIETRVSFRVDQADLRSLFREILEPVGLEFALTQGKLTVFAPKH